MAKISHRRPPPSEVMRCYEIYRRGISANPTEAEEAAFIRLHAELAFLNQMEMQQYYQLIHRLRMLIHLESQRIEWP